MASSGNFCVWNPHNIGSGGSTTLNTGNTNAVMTGADPRTTGTLGGTISDADGFYFETVATSIGGGALTLGIVNNERNDLCMSGQIHSRSGSFMWRPYSSGQFFVETSTNTSYGDYTDGDILGWFVKDSKLYVKKNDADVVGDVANVSGGIPITGDFFFPAVSRTVGGGAQTSSILRPDSDSWSYTPPSGFKGLTSKDINIADAIDPAQTDDDYIGGKQFEAIKYTGNDGSPSNNITYGFKPDMVIHKMLGATGGGYSPQVWDTTRGDDYYMYPTGTAGSVSSGSDYLEFTSTGVKLDNSWDGLNHNGESYISFGWRANGGTTVTNTEGSINNTLQANQNNGFSISQFSNSSGAQTIGHGLGKAPAFYIIKIASSGGGSWGIYHKGLGATKYIRFNSLNGAATASNYFNDTEPTSTVLSVGSTWTATSIMCYAWAEIEGFSKFGIYDGSGSTDGTFIYTGFRPKMVWIKRTNAASVTYGWPVFIDEVNNNINDAYFKNFWLDTYAGAGDNYPLDFLSNGFKHRNNNTNLDASGSTYIYCAWGDVPFKYNNTF